MSNQHLIIEERSKDIGDFMVGRLLPFRKKRMVGPFIFIDHMSPALLGKDRTMSVDQHPHIGLATLTYLIEGAVMHADSIGTLQRISPGAVNLMIAGKGVTHTERTPPDLIGKSYRIEGYQIWLALPKEMEDMEPVFYHVENKDTPVWEQHQVQFRLIAGNALGQQSKLPLWSDLFMIEITSTADRVLNFSGLLKGEIGILVNQGSVLACNEKIEKGHLLVSKEQDVCKIEIQAGSRIFVFGGQPFPEKRFIDWNFVSSSLEKIRQAKADWKNHRFPTVSNDDTYIPYPIPKIPPNKNR